FSAVNSLTLSPALCALMLRPKSEQNDLLSRFMRTVLGWFFTLFNRVFDIGTNGYVWVVRKSMRLALIGLLVYGGLLFLTYKVFSAAPVGFVPLQDKGYLL